jgi:tetratricopeptide (TPR) repeat protein
VAVQAASAHCRQEEWAACDAALQQGRQLLLPLLAPVHRTRATFDLLQARLDAGRGRWPEARIALDSALAMQQRSQAQGVGLVHTALLDGELRRRSGDLPGARLALDRAWRLARQLVQGFAVSEHLGHCGLQEALLLRAEGRPAPALAALREALAQLKQALGAQGLLTRTAEALATELAAD